MTSLDWNSVFEITKMFYLDQQWWWPLLTLAINISKSFDFCFYAEKWFSTNPTPANIPQKYLLISCLGKDRKKLKQYVQPITAIPTSLRRSLIEAETQRDSTTVAVFNMAATLCRRLEDCCMSLQRTTGGQATIPQGVGDKGVPCSV